MSREMIECKTVGTHVRHGNVKGMCTGARRSIGFIEDLETGERWEGIELRIKPDSGDRAYWTKAFANRDKPLPSRQSELENHTPTQTEGAE